MASSTEFQNVRREMRRFSLPFVAPGRILSLVGPVTIDRCTLLADSVRRLDREGTSPILLVVDTIGGSSIGAQIVAAVISFCRSPTIGLVISRAASAGFTVLQACDLRLALATSYVMTHYTNLRDPETPITNARSIDSLQDWMQMRMSFRKAMWTRQEESLCRLTGLDPERIKEMLGRDRDVSAMEAFQLGFIDGIV